MFLLQVGRTWLQLCVTICPKDVWAPVCLERAPPLSSTCKSNPGLGLFLPLIAF